MITMTIQPVRQLLRAAFAGSLVLVASCGDQGLLTAPRPVFEEVGGLAALRLLTSCGSFAPSEVARIGPEGGMLAIGPDTLWIPSGALARKMTVSAHIPPGKGLHVVAFKPEGLVLLKPALLTMGYGECDLTGTGPMHIVELGSSSQITATLRSFDDRTLEQVSASLPSLANYAVAW